MTGLLIKLFIRNSGKLNDYRVRAKYGKFAGMTGIISNILLFAAKIIVGLLANSISVIADAVNNLVDAGSSIITVMGFKISAKPADSEHPYGHARMEYVSGLIVSIVIIVFGLELARNSVIKIFKPSPAEFSIVSLCVLAISISVKFWQHRFYVRIGKLIDSTTLLATAADSRNDVLASIAVLVSAITAYFTGFDPDAYTGLLVSAFVIYSAIRILRETISPLMGLAPSHELVGEINRRILNYESIIGLHDLTVHNYGHAKCFASVHCEVPAEQDILISHDIIDNIERDFLKEMNIQMVIHLDPVVTSDDRTNKLKTDIEKLLTGISEEIQMHDFRVVYGVTHTNLIFDIVVPYEFSWSEKELKKMINTGITELNPSYRSVITVDHISSTL